MPFEQQQNAHSNNTNRITLAAPRPQEMYSRMNWLETLALKMAVVAFTTSFHVASNELSRFDTLDELDEVGIVVVDAVVVCAGRHNSLHSQLAQRTSAAIRERE